MEQDKRLEKLYLNKYILAFYNSHDDDQLIAVFNNPYDMAVSLNKNHMSIKTMITHMKAGRIQTIRIYGYECKLYLIEYEENEDERNTNNFTL